MEKQVLQKKYMNFQLLTERLNALQEQHSALEAHANELTILLSSLDELKQAKEGQEILVPLSSSLFTKAKLQQNQNFIIGVGANVLVEKSFDEAYASITSQKAELSSILKQLEEELQRLMAVLQNLQSEILQEQ